MDCKDLDNIFLVAKDHAENPRNFGMLSVFNGHARMTGPCGDTMEFWLAVRDARVEQVSFVTDGCAPSLAAGSMATSLAQGKPVAEVMRIGQQDILKALGGLPTDSEHCPLLASNTLKAACRNYLGIKPGGEEQPPSPGNRAEKPKNSPKPNLVRKPEESREHFEERLKLQDRMSSIRHKILVMSGKGGVGKSTVAVNLATSLAMAGKQVGLLDVDIHGPSIPTMLGLEKSHLEESEDGLLPVVLGNMKVMSIGFLLASQDDAVIWRGPRKMKVIQQFLSDVAWGNLDYMIIDSPPGTGDEPLSACQLIENPDGAVIVTTPQKVAAVDVRKSVTFCRQLNLPIIGLVENMAGFACPKCGEVTPILSSGAGKRLAADMDVKFLGSIPIDPAIASAGDNGEAFVRQFSASPTARIMETIVRAILQPDKS